MFKGKRKVKLGGLSCYEVNRSSKYGGGIATCFQHHDRLHTLKSHDENEGHEMLVTRHNQFSVPINIINVYGQVESKCTSTVINEKWTALLEQVKKIESKGELLVMIGDLNTHVGDTINGNKLKVSCRGMLVRQFLESGDYVLLNSTDKVKNGPFTRIDPSDATNQSALDLCIVSKELVGYVDSILIDNGRLFTPRQRTR